MRTRKKGERTADGRLISLDDDDDGEGDKSVVDTPRTRLSGSLVGNCVANNKPSPPRKATIWTGWALPPNRYSVDDGVTDYAGAEEDDYLFGCHDNPFLCGSPQPSTSAGENQSSGHCSDQVMRIKSFSPSQWIFGQCSSPASRLRASPDMREIGYVMPTNRATDFERTTNRQVLPTPSVIQQHTKRKLLSPSANVCGKSLGNATRLKDYGSVRLEAD